MPSQDGLGLYSQSCPGASWQAITQGGQHHPIGRRPSDPLDLTLKDLDLAPERQHLSLELLLVASARRDRIEEHSDLAANPGTQLHQVPGPDPLDHLVGDALAVSPRPAPRRHRRRARRRLWARAPGRPSRHR